MTTPPRVASPHLVELHKAWRKREQDLLAGKAIPCLQDRYNGHSAFTDSALADLRQVCEFEVALDRLPPEQLAALQLLFAAPTGDQCWLTCQLVAKSDAALSSVLLWHAALRGHRQALQDLLHDTVFERRPHDRVGWSYMTAMAVGLCSLSGKLDDIDGIEVSLAVLEGMQRLRYFGEMAADRDAAVDAIEAEEDAGEEAKVGGMVGALAAMKRAQEEEAAAELADDFMAAIEEDRAEIRRSTMMVVVPGNSQEKPSGGRADVVKSFKHVTGKELPLVGLGKLASARTELVAAFPHMAAEMDAILRTQAALPAARFALLLVSDPGVGKTTVARAIADSLGVPHMTYPCGAASDGAFGGTSAQWNSARASVPLQLIGRSRVANPVVILDELDKVGTSRQNGSLPDVLLGFLERQSARSYHDLALEQDVDLSAVSYIATANRIEDVPPALRDRLKVVRVPAPAWQHLGVLTERIIDDLAAERGLDRRWIDPLAQDEVEVVKRCWPGGSFRQLQTVVTRLVDGRDALMGRA